MCDNMPTKRIKMSATSPHRVIPEEEATGERADLMKELEVVIRSWTRRARGPARRMAVAEAEHEFNEWKRRWSAAGLIPAEAQPAA